MATQILVTRGTNKQEHKVMNANDDLGGKFEGVGSNGALFSFADDKKAKAFQDVCKAIGLGATSLRDAP